MIRNHYVIYLNLFIKCENVASPINHQNVNEYRNISYLLDGNINKISLTNIINWSQLNCGC